VVTVWSHPGKDVSSFSLTSLDNPAGKNENKRETLAVRRIFLAHHFKKGGHKQ
jgi:hypothetical protein